MLMAEHSMCQPGRPSPEVGRPAGLAGLGGLPEREVAHVVLLVLVRFDALADALLAWVEAGQPAVGRPRRDAEEDRAVLGPVGVAALEQRGDEGDHVVDVLGGAGHDVRRGDAQACQVLEEAGRVARRELADGDALAGPRRG